MAKAVVAVLTGDDLACLREEFRKDSDEPYEKALTPQARPNVLFEAGMALGLHPDRTILVQIGEIRPFSNIGGRHLLRFDGTAAARNDLKERLKGAGCAVNDSGVEWLWR
jgi:hypothetical protein